MQIPIKLGAVLVCILLSACSAVEKYLQNPTPAVISGSVLFADDFTSEVNNWKTWSEPDAMVVYQAGGLHFLINQPDKIFWSRPGYKFSDVLVQVDAIKVGGPENNHFGVICRMTDEQNFYAFLISSDGYAGILKSVDGQMSLLNSTALQYSADIRQGPSLNQITAGCDGNNLSLAINGQPAFQVTDDTFVRGDVGLIAGTYQEIGVEILFDNLVVLQP